MPDRGAEYEILLSGSIGTRTLRALGPVHMMSTGAEGTRLRCRLADQAALHGVLERIRDLGLELLDVHRLP